MTATTLPASDDVPMSDAETLTAMGDRSGDPTLDTGSSASTRARLLTSAIEIIEEKGLEGLRVAEVARRAGLTTGAIYANYLTKAELVAAAIVSQQEDLFRAALEAGLNGAGTGDPSGFGASLLTALTQESTAQDRPLLEVLASATRDAKVREVAVDRLNRRADLVHSYIERAQARDQIRSSVSTDALAYVIQLLGLGTVVAHAIELPAPDPDELRTLLEDVFTELGRDHRA
jgi:AcrR family transcriptional regulator